MKQVLHFLLFITLVSACQVAGNREQPILFADFYLRYLESEKQLKAEAIFSEGDSVSVSKSTSMKTVFFNGEAMQARDLGKQGIRYRVEQRGDYRSEYTFAFKKEGQAQLEQKLKMPAIKNIQLQGTASRSAGFTISWEGEAVGKDESLVVLFTDASNKAAAISIEGPSQQSSVTLTASQLDQLASGPTSMYLVKKRMERTASDHFRAVGISEFYTKSLKIDIVD